jgi:hypothetical protein
MVVERARSVLAERLNEQVLALFLGAGVSMAVGLPDWRTLTERCGIRAEMDRDDLDRRLAGQDYQGIIAEVEKRYPFDEYAEVVRAALYEGFKGVSFSTCRCPLLIALGSLVSGGQRGRVSEIVSLNFDDILEWYLSLHGYRTQSVSNMPRLLKSGLIQVYHIHGFLAHPERSRKRSNFLVFSRGSAEERLTDIDNPFKAVMVQVLRTKVSLFVGMSEKTAIDYLLSPLLKKVAQEGAATEGRPTGFWLFDAQISEEVATHLKDRNVVPLTFPSRQAIAEFLLSVCGEAGRALQA